MTPLQEVKGVIHVFLIDELEKTPPRARVINHTRTINEFSFKNKKEAPWYFHQANHRDAKKIALSCTHGIAVDEKACFNQFPLGPEIQQMCCVFVDGAWYMLTRLAMGQRQSCYIADALLHVLASQFICEYVAYVDNLLFGGDPEALERDLKSLRERAKEANVT